ncbi:MAG: MBL fold metallo-hydrolase [bacterium]|nr:MBL fold metallo-hydrolase [bacterium]
MKVNICVLGSGSSGNCTVIWNEKEALLVDCGKLGDGYIIRQLDKLKIPPDTLTGILITHGHSDHFDPTAVKIAKYFQIPVYIHEITYQSVRKRYKSAKVLDQRGLVKHHDEKSFNIGEFFIEPFKAYHSQGYVGKPFGFSIINSNVKIGYFTDSGRIDTNIVQALSGSSAAIIETNHEEELVRSGYRNESNKEWILSDFGHLSNKCAAELIGRIAQPEHPLRYVFLAHISKDHNTIDRALAQVSRSLNSGKIKLLPTYHDKPSNVVMI